MTKVNTKLSKAAEAKETKKMFFIISAIVLFFVLLIYFTMS
jgi:hypothetical protein